MSDDFDPATVSWVLDQADLDHLLAAIETASQCVIDLETTALDEYADGSPHRNGGVPARIVLASLTLPQAGSTSVPTTYIVPLSHPDSPWLGKWRTVIKNLSKTLKKYEIPLSNQNMKFDARWIFAHTRVDLSGLIVWDTRVSSALDDETRSQRLKDRAPEEFGIPPWDDFDLSKPGAAERVPLFDLGMYAARDTYWTWRLEQLHRQRFFATGDSGAEEPEGPEELEGARLGRLAVWCAMPSVATMTAVEQRGIKLDVEWTKRTLEEVDEEAAEAYAWLIGRHTIERDGDPSFAPTSHWFRDWAAAAVEAGDLQVTSLTPSGSPQWTKEVLVRQARHGSETAAMLLKYRRAVKRAEFLRSWLDRVSPDGAIHATYNVGAAATGRLSSSDPNMQQVTKALRPAFVPRQGYLIADVDLSQIELRVGAFMSRSEPMMEAFERGDDLHRILAANLIGCAPEDVPADERQKGKAGNFGLLFGMGAAGFQVYAENSYDVSLTFEEAQQVHRTFFETWEGIAEWHARQMQRARQTGQVVSPIGRVRRLPEIHSGVEALEGAAERIAINSPVQGFASDILQIGAASIEGTLPGHEPVPRVRIVATVHDSIVAEVPEDTWEEDVVAMLERLLKPHAVLERMDCFFDVPLAAEASVGTRWGLSDVGVLEADSRTL